MTTSNITRQPPKHIKNIFDDLTRIGIMNFLFTQMNWSVLPLTYKSGFHNSLIQDKMSKINEIAIAALSFANEKDVHQLFHEKKQGRTKLWNQLLQKLKPNFSTSWTGSKSLKLGLLMEKPSFIRFLLNNTACSSSEKDALMEYALTFAARAKRFELLYHICLLPLYF